MFSFSARDVSVLASGGVGVGEQQGASHGGTGSGPTQTYQESDTTGDRNVDGHPSETQTVADAGADHQSSTDQDISAVVQEEIHKILAAGEIGPVILPINDTATKAHTAADLAGTEQSGGRNPPLSSPTETGTRAGRAAEVTGGVNKDNTPVAVSSSILDGSPTHLPPDSALGSPDGSRLTREDEDGSVNATDCLTLDECEEEIIDEFIEVRSAQPLVQLSLSRRVYPVQSLSTPFAEKVLLGLCSNLVDQLIMGLHRPD